LIRIASQIVGEEKKEADRARLLYRWFSPMSKRGARAMGVASSWASRKPHQRLRVSVPNARIPVAIAITRNV